MNLNTRLNNLEARQKVIRCLWCRYALTASAPRGKDAPAPEVIETKCWFCGTRFNLPLKGHHPKLKEAVSLVLLSHPTQWFKDERIHTAKEWTKFFECLPLIPYYQESAEVPQPVALSKKRQALKDAAYAYYEQQMERYKRIANGPAAFPIDVTLAEIEKACHPPSHSAPDIPADIPASCRQEVESVVRDILRFMRILRSAAACEIILWGEVLPETQTEIAFFEKEQARRIEVIVKAEAAREQERIKTQPTPKPAPTAFVPAPVLPVSEEPPAVLPVIKAPSTELLTEANRVEWPSEAEEETPLQRAVREREELLRRLSNGYDRAQAARVPLTLPSFPS